MNKISNFFFLLILTSCSTVYYNFWETLGKEKRDLLKSKIENVTESQDDIKEEFEDTLSKIRSQYKFKETDLERTYDSLKSDYEGLDKESKYLSSQINKSEDIANDLFSEWKTEAYKLNNKSYKAQSLNKLTKTKTKFKTTLRSMRIIEKDLAKVLKRFNDQVIFIKHNLNAKIVANLKSELISIEAQIKRLIRQINSSTSKAKNFIKDI
jgi:uncharacterized FlaG/YvyC family protein